MNIRKLAMEAIEKIIYKGAFSNIVINECLNKFEFSDSERALYTILVMGTIERKLTLQYFIEPYLKKKQKPWLYSLLLMSVYQIVYMDVKNYYVVDEAVKLAKLYDNNIASFTNAVLRNFLRNPLRDIEELKNESETKYLSIKYSTPEWLVAYLLKDYKMDVVIKLIDFEKENNLNSIRVNTLKATNEEIEEFFNRYKIEYKKSDLVKNGYLVSGSVIDLPIFKMGKITASDASSQRVSEVLNPSENSLVLDMCSAPGSKTCHMAAIMNNTGRIYACDIHEHKLKLMKKNFDRLGVTNVILQGIDARLVRTKVRKEAFDYCLIDMPCSGLGVISHKVDLKYNITLDKINEVIELQKQIIESSYDVVKKDGFILVSTCTINKSENEEQVKLFMNNHPDLIKVYEETIMPFEHDCDGFYICKLQKRG